MLRRLEARGLGRAEAEMRLRSQRSEEEFRSAADVVIENDADRERTKDRVREAWSRARA
jgi:dephospho-CoA kinase